MSSIVCPVFDVCPSSVRAVVRVDNLTNGNNRSTFSKILSSVRLSGSLEKKRIKIIENKKIISNYPDRRTDRENTNINIYIYIYYIYTYVYIQSLIRAKKDPDNCRTHPGQTDRRLDRIA